MSKKKIILFSVGAAAVIAFAVISLMSENSNAVAVQASAVDRRDLTETVSASGRIQPQTKVEITAEVSGAVISLPVVEGQTVLKGELLIVIDTIQIMADVRQAKYGLDASKAQLGGAKARFAEAEEEYLRQKSLFEKDGTAETAMSTARYAHLAAKAALDGAVAQMRATQAGYEKQLDRYRKARIVAPMDGVITYLDVEVGEIAPAQTAFTQGKTLMTISDLSVFEVEVEVDETEVNKIELSQATEIEVDAIPDTSFVGQVVEIGNTAIMIGAGTQDQSTNFRVKVMFEDVNVRLRPGMSATVDITSAERNEVITVPFSAVVMRSYDLDSLAAAREAKEANEPGVTEVHAAENGDAEVKDKEDDEEREDLKGVFAIRDGLAVFVEIQTGIAGQKNIEVTSGLLETDSIISGPYRVLRTIKDGDAVKIEEPNKDKDEEES